MEGIKVLHTGDIHLGYEYEGDYEYGIIRRKELQETFSYIIELCRREQVDVMLIAGDLFHSDCPDENLVSFVIEEFHKIADVMVMIAPGNHDYYIEGSYYDRINTLCNNVFVFDGDMDYYEFNIRNQIARIYGAGFGSGVVRESLMRQRVIPEDNCISIGVFHGTVSGQMTKNHYNPISVKQIEDNGFDYLALGHIHKRSEVLRAGTGYYAYCGCPEGLSFGTQGIKGVYLGMVYSGYADMRFVPTGKRSYEEVKVDMNQCLKDSGEDFNVGRATGEYIRYILRKRYGEDYAENIYRIVIEGALREAVRECIDINRLKKELEDIFYVEILNQTTVEESSVFQRDFFGSGSQDTDRAFDVQKKNGNSFIIKKIHIGAFGGLKDFTQNYHEGLNLIYGKNEYGKSTIMAFIRMMLYGCSSKSKDISQNIRRRYEPFSGEKMSGSMECESGGKTYRIEMEFGRTKGNDIRHIYEKASGREIVLPKEQEAGEYFLGLREGEFLKTMFEDNMGHYEGGDMRTDLLERIAHLNAGLSETESRVKSSGEYIEALDREIEKLMSKRGTSGEIPEVTEQIEEYRAELERLQEEKRNLKEKQQQNFAMEKRERKILEDLIEKMEQLQESGQGDKSEYHMYKVKYFLHFCITMFLGVMDICMIFAADRYRWGMFVLAVLAVLTVIYGVKAILDKMGMDRNKPFDRKLSERIEVIKEELGYQGYSVRELGRRIDEIDRHLTSGMDMIDERIDSRIRRCEKRISELTEKRNRLKQVYHQKVEKRNSLMRDAERVSAALSEPIHQRAIELLNEMTGDDYEGMIVDAQYAVKVRKRGMATFKEWKHLSTATAMQVYLAVRIALCELLGEKGVAVPILMDDILNYCDEDRMERTLRVLKNLNRQVILLTCHRVG